jgi:hypothetical protein
LGEATGILTTPHTAGHSPVPPKQQPGEVLGNLLNPILINSADHLQVQCDQVLDFILRKPREKYSTVRSSNHNLIGKADYCIRCFPA